MTFTDAQTAAALAATADEPLQMDEEAFRGFYDRTSRMLWAYLERLTGDRQSADDLLQESYYRFLRSGATLDGEAHRRHYLFRIATNLVRDRIRRSRTRPTPLAQEYVEAAAAPGVPQSAVERAAGSDARDVAAQGAGARAALARVRAGRLASRDRADGRRDPCERQAAALPRAAQAGRAARPYGAARMKTPISCPHESDVLELVSIGQWPARADAALREHAAGCDVCADLAAASAAIIELRDAPAQDIKVPDASVVWYRAQIHARVDAAARAARPLRMAQAAGAVCFLAVALAWWSTGTSWLSSVWSRLAGLTFSLPRLDFAPSFGTVSATWLSIGATVAIAWMVLLSVAWYLADVADE